MIGADAAGGVFSCEDPTDSSVEYLLCGDGSPLRFDGFISLWICEKTTTLFAFKQFSPIHQTEKITGKYAYVLPAVFNQSST